MDGNMKKYALIVVSMFAVSIFMIVSSGCSSGGGDNSLQPSAPAETTHIQGTVLAPNGQLALFQQHGMFASVLEFIVPHAQATITGLSPVPDATVELVRIDNNGTQLGGILASAKTDGEGAYAIDLPAGVTLASNLVIRVAGVSGVMLRALAVSENVTIDPLSEFITRSLISAGLSLDKLDFEDIKNVQDKVEAFEIAASADIDATLDHLTDTIGASLSAQIAVLGVSESSADSLVGTYHSMSHYLYMDSIDDDETSNTLGSGIDLGTAVIITENGITRLQGQGEQDTNLELCAILGSGAVQEYEASLDSYSENGQNDRAEICVLADRRVLVSHPMIDVPEQYETECILHSIC